MHRPIFSIAKDIREEWGPKIYFGARPYLDAMTFLSHKGDKYGLDNAESIVLYFLSNASTFRGDRAKELKQELRDALKGE